MLRWTIKVSFSTFREVPIAGAFQTSGVTLENIAYCTEYELEIRLKGKKKGNNSRKEEIHSMKETLTKQQPNQFVKPNVIIYEEYTSLKCSAR